MVNLKCVVKGCKNNNYQGKVKKKFHKFPTEEALRQEWIAAVKKDDELKKNAVVCSDHFEDQDYKVKGEKNWWLEKTAVPSLNLGIQEDEVPPPPPRKRRRSEDGVINEAKKIISCINGHQELPECSSSSEAPPPLIECNTDAEQMRRRSASRFSTRHTICCVNKKMPRLYPTVFIV